MKWFVSTLFMLCVGLMVPAAGFGGGKDAPEKAAQEKAIHVELARIHGEFQLEKVIVAGQTLIAPLWESAIPASYLFGVDGKGFQLIVKGKVQEVGLFEVDPVAQPKRFTLSVSSKDLTKGATLTGIYSLSDDGLVLAFTSGNRNQRPDDFSGRGPLETVWHFKRVKADR